MEGHNDNQAPSITTVDNEVDDECSRNKSEDADQVNCSFRLKLMVIKKRKRSAKSQKDDSSKHLNLLYS